MTWVLPYSVDVKSDEPTKYTYKFSPCTPMNCEDGADAGTVSTHNSHNLSILSMCARVFTRYMYILCLPYFKEWCSQYMIFCITVHLHLTNMVYLQRYILYSITSTYITVMPVHNFTRSLDGIGPTDWQYDMVYKWLWLTFLYCQLFWWRCGFTGCYKVCNMHIVHRFSNILFNSSTLPTDKQKWDLYTQKILQQLSLLKSSLILSM